MPRRRREKSLIELGIVLFVGTAIVAGVAERRRNEAERMRREAAWTFAMADMQIPIPPDSLATYAQYVERMTWKELETSATKVFNRIGYEVTHSGQTGDHGVDVRLVNPHRQIEIVQCKQYGKPVGEPEVRDLLGTMVHVGAVRGYL